MATHLLLVTGGVTRTRALPERGAFVIGRDPECDIPVEDPSLSRRHAILRVEDEITIEDLESANGTRVRGQKLAPGERVTIQPGEFVDLGTTLVLVQQASPRRAPVRLWTHGYFEARLEEECARAARTGGKLVLLHVRHDPVPTLPTSFADLLRPEDVAGVYGPGQLEILLVDASAEDAERLAPKLSAALSYREGGVQVGIACFPRDASSAHALAARAVGLVRGAGEEGTHETVVGDPAMRAVYDLANRVAQGTIHVLLLGETGVGKEVLAEHIHARSPRAKKPLLRLNCAAFAETLLESELFGHEKGAFTGAARTKPGLLESADGGTVLLDEVGEMPLSVQIKLLRVLEDHKTTRVGGLKPTSIDVRFISATNRDLEHEIERGTFRRDFYFRINGISLLLPPLRERAGEIDRLANAFVVEMARRASVPVPRLSSEALEMLRGYAWPGNIRELRNFIERAVLLSTDGVIRPEHLPLEKMKATVGTHAVPEEDGESLADRIKKGTLAMQKKAVLDALAQTAGNQTEAALLLGVSRRTLSNWLDTLDIPRPRKGR